MQVLLNKDASVVLVGRTVGNTNVYQYSLENLRGMSIICVMLTHIVSVEDLGAFGRYWGFLFGDATGWFVFISGYLFNRIENAKFNYSNYLKKKAKFVILPYLILSVPAIVCGLYFKRHLVMGLDAVGYALWSLLVGGSVLELLWFIPMIAIYFLLSPLFYQLGRSRFQYMCLPILVGVSMYTNRPIENLNPFFSFVHFIGFYVLGIFVSSNAFLVARIKETRLATLLMLGGLLLFILAFLYMSDESRSYPPGFIDGLWVFDKRLFGKLCLLVTTFLLFDRYLDAPNAFLGWAARVSFGLFFLQGFFIVGFSKFGQYIDFLGPIFRLVAELAVVIAGPMLAVTIAKAVLGKRSRYVIGC